MPLVWRILLGLVVAFIGFLLVWRTSKILEWFGANAWAEEKIGPGGSWLFYKLIGVAFAFAGIFIATGIMSNLMEGFARLFVRGV